MNTAKKWLLLLPLTLSVSLSSSNVKAEDASQDLTLEAEIVSKFLNTLKSPLLMENEITFAYNSYIPSLKIVDEFDSNNRINKIKILDQIVQEKYIVKNKFGNAAEAYLSISNTLETRELIGANNEAVKFDTAYKSPFKRLVALTSEQVNNYFTIDQVEENYTLTANALGYGVLSEPILAFYADYDAFLWDTSVRRSIENLTFTIDAQGNPLSFSFDKIKKDAFGGLKEQNFVSITPISAINGLTTVTGSMTNEEKEIFNTKLQNFQSLINNGNFTQNILIAPQGYTDGIEYSNFYALQEENRTLPKLALCGLPLVDSHYGETYVGLLSEGNPPEYAVLGISPQADYYNAVNDKKYTELSQMIPQPGSFSADYFTYSKATDEYKFNISDFMYDDYYFSRSILTALFGVMDPCSNITGFYFYNEGGFRFDTLTLKFDDNGILSGSLSFNYFGSDMKSTFSFSNINTTDVKNEESLKTIIDYLFN